MRLLGAVLIGASSFNYPGVVSDLNLSPSDFISTCFVDPDCFTEFSHEHKDADSQDDDASTTDNVAGCYFPWACGRPAL